jgi:hypothetical protein
LRGRRAREHGRPGTESRNGRGRDGMVLDTRVKTGMDEERVLHEGGNSSQKQHARVASDKME